MRSPTLSRAPLATAIQRTKTRRTILPGALLTLLLMGATQANATPVDVDVPAQSLGSALQQLGQQANLQVLYSPDSLQGLKSTAVSGHLEPEQALNTLLLGSGITFQLTGNTVSLIPIAGNSNVLQLGPVSINGQALGQTTEGSGSYTTGATSTAMKIPLSLRETPQSITVIGRQQIEDQNLTSLPDVLNLTPGITVSNFQSELFNFNSRGFNIENFQFDGMPSYYDPTYTGGMGRTDMAVYDRVEVLRGATGLMTGVGSPSATINLVRKKPTKEFQASVTQGVGTRDLYRTEADVSGPLNEAGTLRGRFVGVMQKKDSLRDYYSNDKKVAYGIFEADLTPDTLLTAGIDYQISQTNGAAFGSQPLFYSDGSQAKFSRSLNTATRWSYWDITNSTVFANIEQQLAYDWKAKVAFSHQSDKDDSLMMSASGGYPDKVTGAGVYQYRCHCNGERRSNNVDAYVQGPFELFGRIHDMTVGMTASRSHLVQDRYKYSTSSKVDNFFDWNGTGPRLEYQADGKDEQQDTQTGYYATARFKPLDPLSLLVGARVVNFKREATGVRIDPTSYRDPDVTFQENGRIIPYAGIVYDLNENFSVYGSYTSIFRPQGYRDTSGGFIDPEEGDNIELGIKGEFFDGRLNASAAVFQVTQDNYANYVTSITLPDGSPRDIYKAMNDTKTKGFELEVSGEVATGLQLAGGFTHRESKDKDGNKLQGDQPDDLFKLSTAYTLPGNWNALTVGGNVTWQSQVFFKTTVGDIKAKATQDDYYVVGLFGRYKIDEHLTASVNVTNLFDTHYYSTFGRDSYGSVLYGDPRAAVLSMNYKF
ncbi:TonB-dependent siderophore receptor [Pseudomonas purpurea]|uniref:TonB-dependent siderophore receptor n=1 Tax=Pseudomonas purpurea TaxID=3136737 RepID=UPI003266F17D